MTSARVHLSSVAGSPILGDVAYTKGTEDRGRGGQLNVLACQRVGIPLLVGQVHTFSAKDPFVVDVI